MTPLTKQDHDKDGRWTNVIIAETPEPLMNEGITVRLEGALTSELLLVSQ
jgi:hypothetical protein